MAIHPSFDLRQRARQALLENGFAPDMPTGEGQSGPFPSLEQLRAQLSSDRSTADVLADLRALPWSSIDNDDSRDLDQIEVIIPSDELSDKSSGSSQVNLLGDLSNDSSDKSSVRLLVGIADVASYVPAGSPIDQHAYTNTTTIYTGILTFPMLPEALSTGQTSLLDAEDRLAIVIDMRLNEAGETTDTRIYPALVRNRARFTYEEIGEWLQARDKSRPDALGESRELEEQLLLQQKVAHAIYQRRLAAGALEFETVEAHPVVKDGEVVSLTVSPKNEARRIIENFMITANTAMATFLAEQGQPSIQRVVRTPARWNRIRELAQSLGEALPEEPDARALSAFLAERKRAAPDHFTDLSLSVVKLLGPGEYAVVASSDDPQGHFGLAAYRYTHATAPNRRYADLVIQRLLLALLSRQAPPYSTAELANIATRCNERENASRKVERLMRKIIAAHLLRDQIGETFEAIVTGASPKGTYVRVVSPPVEGRVVRHEAGLDVGDRVMVRLIDVDAERGFIDFERF